MENLMENLIKLNFEKAREELGLKDCEELIAIYVKKENYNVYGFNYSTYIQSEGQAYPQLYLECDLKEWLAIELIEKK